ncbi:amidohydrolase [Peristeroidobacter soli]|uniref:amidohydrolase n=1 Tax=Peristeroidobacter soli TaxID=2497877 RepID=UPI00101CD614|nr:amidohydrolase [Peristeroidobacter soli]
MRVNENIRYAVSGAALALLTSWVASVGLAAESAGTDSYGSIYRASVSPPTLIRNATLLIGDGTRIDNGDVLIVDGKIAAVGRGLSAPAGARILEARGRWVTPGLIDVHSHVGVLPSPYVDANSDGNEVTNPVTANVWVEHSVWTQDPAFQTALEGGITTLQILPGSANLVGGRSVVLKNVPAVSVRDMKFPGAPIGVKMACGENPKRVYGDKGTAPSTRMGNVAGFRQAFSDAQDYQRQLQKYQRELAKYQAAEAAPADSRKKKADDDKGKEEPPAPPKRDLKLETLVSVLNGEARVHIHCYRADDMSNMLALADEFGFKIAAFHHGVEAYKIADRLAERGVCGALWADWWGFKMEAYDGIQENLALVDYPQDSCAITHSDSSEGIQRLNQESAKSMAHARALGLSIPPERAIRWLTSNAAKALGLSDRIGTLATGMNADVVIWNRDPFSVYSLAEQVFIDGSMQFDRSQPQAPARSDFMLGQDANEELR